MTGYDVLPRLEHLGSLGHLEMSGKRKLHQTPPFIRIIPLLQSRLLDILTEIEETEAETLSESLKVIGIVIVKCRFDPCFLLTNSLVCSLY